jgi:hypothetical protein
MHQVPRTVLVGVVCIAIGCRSARPAQGSVLDVRTGDSVVRLRPEGSFERRVIAEGLCGSATFRTLVDTIQRSDVIVYVSMKWLGDRRLRGRLDFLTATATDRVLRAVFSFPLDRETRIAVLGHELQHAVEVAVAPDIRTRGAFAAHYRAHGRPVRIESGYDTDAARRVELQIRVDLARAAPCNAEP